MYEVCRLIILDAGLLVFLLSFGHRQQVAGVTPVVGLLQIFQERIFATLHFGKIIMVSHDLPFCTYNNLNVKCTRLS